ncbi:MAG: D-alanyl-D-alanine carboxypeptidase [Lachnospiraceae bacterium]|nr:D-alanyl-D-alanine carboxypeptidase [Lachnospiraceae bacterium]
MAEYNRENLSEEELEWQRRRRERVQRMKLEKEKEIQKQRMIKRAMPVAAIVLVIGIVSGVALSGRAGEKTPDSKTVEENITAKAEDLKNRENGLEASGEQIAGNEEIEAVKTEGNMPEGMASVSQGEPDSQEVAATPGQITANSAATGTTVSAAPNIVTAGNGKYEAHTTDATTAPPGEVESTNVVFIDLESGDVLAQRGYKEVVNPASMTKVLTLLVAAEHVTDLDDTFTITIDITDYSYVNDCSNVGFEVGETVTVRDLLYGTILPSGGDAAVGLATYVAGSHEAFVEMMNDKLEELGLSGTAHFTNCVGIYDKNHHCSVYDMAMIMEAALANDLCREVLGARTYTTSSTAQHPEGITISNWFIRRIEDKDTGGEILGAKTGYVNESGSCAVSYGVDASGKGYVCATTGAHSSWRCIYDHVALYKTYSE